MAKRVVTTTVRMTGVTKAVITGGGRAHKAKPAEATTIYQDNADLGAAVLDVCRQVLLSEPAPYKYETRKALEKAVEKAVRLAELIGGRGAGSVNEGACTSTSRQLTSEISNIVAQTYPPSMKTNILYLVQLHASVVEKFSTATNTDLKINESKRLEELGKAFPIIAKEVFPHIPDLTYAQPLLDGCSLVPRVTYDVRELVKTAAVYTAGETYATNSCKTLFYLLNDIRRNAMSGFPPGPYDEKFPQVGPPDAQFQLSSAEFATSIADAAAAPQDVQSADSAPQFVSFDDINGIPPPPAQDDENNPMMSSDGHMSVSSYGSYGSSSDTSEVDPQFGSPIGLLARNPHLQGGHMHVGSAPTASNLNQAMMMGRPPGAMVPGVNALSLSQGGSPGSGKLPSSLSFGSMGAPPKYASPGQAVPQMLNNSSSPALVASPAPGSVKFFPPAAKVPPPMLPSGSPPPVLAGTPPGSGKIPMMAPPAAPGSGKLHMLPKQPTMMMTPSLQQQQATLQQQQLIIQQQQQQLLMQQQQQQQEVLIKQQQEELLRQQQTAADTAKQASALDELSKLEWNI